MATPEVIARRNYERQTRLTKATRRTVGALWRRMRVRDLDGSWRVVGPLILAAVTEAQRAAADRADVYTDDVLTALGIESDRAGNVRADALAGVASDGRELGTLLQGPVIAAKIAIGKGAAGADALLGGLANLHVLVGTQIADAGRIAESVSLASRPRVGGYVRMLSVPSCSRCVVLAGKFFRWNTGFQRHPLCDCRHIPTNEDVAGDLRTDPKAYFDSLSEREQNRIFTEAGAASIRLGADINQVVNARRGALGLYTAAGRLTREEARMLRDGQATGRLLTTRVFGRDAFTTTEGTSSRGFAGRRLGDLTKQDGNRYRTSRTPRLMPEQIMRDATSREDAIRLLRRFGFII